MVSTLDVLRTPGLLCLILGVLTACPQRPLEPRDPSPGATHFTIQTFNVEFTDWDDPATVAAVGHSSADVLCLQEVTPSWQATLTARYGEQYPYSAYHVLGERSTGGLAVLSRFPIEDLGIAPAPNGWHPAWHLQVVTPAGPLQLLQVHLRSPLTGQNSALESYLRVEEDHRLEIELFFEPLRSNLPTIVLGDFNEDVDGAAVRFLELRGFVNALPLFHPGQGTWRYRSIANQLDRALDHIFYGPGLTPLNAWVHRSGNSDHLPVIAHLEFSPN